MQHSQSQSGGDYWTDKDVPQPVADRPRAIVLSGIVPLDAQVGAFPRKTMPDGLSEHLFAHGPVIYAVLDGAKIDALPEILEASGLQHRCLFTGQAAEDHGEAAPWLVELHPEAALLRQLCTRSEARSHYWGAEPLFLRSQAGFEALWRHLRKFTQLRDTGGRWTFFRFWQTDILMDILARDGSILADAFLIPDRIEAMIGLDSDGEGAVLSHSTAEPAPVPRLDGRLGHAITAAMQRRRARQIAGMLRQDFAAELAHRPLSDLRKTVEASLRRMHGYRFTSMPLLYTLTAWEVFYGPLDRLDEGLGRTLASHLSEQRKFCRIRDRLAEVA